MKKVVICQHRLLHYRTNFFERLKEACALRYIDLNLLHGQASPREAVKKDEGSLPWAYKVKNKFLELGSRDLVWQPFPNELRDADLTVIMQESRILSNYPLLIRRLWLSQKIAYWGHGINFQSTAPAGIREKWKSLLLKQVDWWFAYTDITTDILKKAGYPSNKITCLNNAIDTNSFKADLAAVTASMLMHKRKELGIDESSPVGLFCGSLYPDKRLDFLVEAVDKIQMQFENFHCLIIGDGPSTSYILEAAAKRPWFHVLGIQKGIQKALYFRMADFMLNPGLVGLHLVDAFCGGLVMVTTSNARHSPEIAYLKNGVNGFMTPDGTDEYATTVIDLARNKEQLIKVKAAALLDADVYTLDNMVAQFVDGIEKCLISDRHNHSGNN